MQRPVPHLRSEQADPAARLAASLSSRFGGDALTAALSMQRYMNEHGFSDRARLYQAAALILRG
jgi:hypothetical protein